MRYAPIRLSDRVVIDPPIYLAPMAGVTSGPFRMLCKREGAGMVTSEVISSSALSHGNAKSFEIMKYAEEERPIGLQIFGGDPAMMAEAARYCESRGADVVDINMGCAVRKVAKTGGGCIMMRDPQHAVHIIRAVVDAVRIPVTLKMRLGWTVEQINAVELARAAQDAGIRALTVHGRTGCQMFHGEADWRRIEEVKQAVEIPVIGNGDVKSPQDVERMFAVTGCDGVMIGRGAQGDPHLFHRVRHYLETGEHLPEPTPAERLRTALKHARMLREWKGEHSAVLEMRGHVMNYTRGLRHSAAIRDRVSGVKTMADLEELIESYLHLFDQSELPQAAGVAA